jgi:hypothetical protein
VPDPLPRSSTRFPAVRWGQVEGVADPGERGERVGRHRVEQAGWVAQPFGEGTAEREVERGGGLLRHLPVERLDLPGQFGRVELRWCGHLGLRSTSQEIG